MEPIEKIIMLVLGSGFVGFATWAVQLKSQLRKARNSIITDDNATTDKSLEVSLKLIETNQFLQDKVATMMKQVSIVMAELEDLRQELANSNKRMTAFAETCSCGASKIFS